jgi:hypothetical protein
MDRNGDIKYTRFRFDLRKKWIDLSDEEIIEPIGEIKITSTYDPSWINTNEQMENGGLYYDREDKMVKKFPTQRENSGDLKQRKIIEAARHKIEFKRVLDDIFGTLLNKSDLTPDKMDPRILTFIKWKTKEYSKTLYKNHYRSPSSCRSVEGESDPPQINEIVDNIHANNTEIVNELITSNPNTNTNTNTNTRPHIVSPPMVVFGFRFSIEASSRILSIEDEETNRIIARAKTYGEGSSLRKWCCARLREGGRQSFIEFISTTPTIFEYSSDIEYLSAI